MAKPLILVTNDDGIAAPGIRALVETARKYGDVIVVAPDSPQSGQGHAITIESPLRLYQVKMFEEWAVPAYECSGTPVDCVKLAKHILLPDRKVDLCVSGINHGSNASINIIYSGTMSAAMEAALEGIPAIGFSLLNYRLDADFSACQPLAGEMIDHVLKNGMKDTMLLNVNFPDIPQIKGFKACRQAEGYWRESFIEGKDPGGRPYYWLAGKFVCQDEGEDTDIAALEAGYASVVPSMHDLTAYPALKHLKTLETSSLFSE